MKALDGWECWMLSSQRSHRESPITERHRVRGNNGYRYEPILLSPTQQALKLSPLEVKCPSYFGQPKGLPSILVRHSNDYGPALEAPARRRGRLCAGVTWRATDWIHLFTMHAHFLARKVGGREMDPELRVEPFSWTSQAFVRKEP